LFSCGALKGSGVNISGFCDAQIDQPAAKAGSEPSAAAPVMLGTRQIGPVNPPSQAAFYLNRQQPVGSLCSRLREIFSVIVFGMAVFAGRRSGIRGV
jgi:hypothetical protein